MPLSLLRSAASKFKASFRYFPSIFMRTANACLRGSIYVTIIHPSISLSHCSWGSLSDNTGGWCLAITIYYYLYYYFYLLIYATEKLHNTIYLSILTVDDFYVLTWNFWKISSTKLPFPVIWLVAYKPKTNPTERNNDFMKNYYWL